MPKPSYRGRWTAPASRVPIKRALDFLVQPGVWLRIGLFLATTTILYVIMFGWIPAFPCRTRIAPLRNLHARAAFQTVDADATSHARTQARGKFANFYVNKPRPLDKVRQALIDDLLQVKQKSFAELKSDNLWSRFLAVNPETGQPNPEEDTAKEFSRLNDALIKDERLVATGKAVESAFVNIRRRGLLRNLEHELGDGSMEEIQVYESDIGDSVTVNVPEIRLAEVLEALRANLLQEFRHMSGSISEPEIVAERVFNWLKPRLPMTLTWDKENSRRGRSRAANDVENRFKQYLPGDPLERFDNQGIDEPVIQAFEPLDEADINLLRLEHDAFVASHTVNQRIFRSVSLYALFAAVAALLCGYLYCRDEDLLGDMRNFATLLGMSAVTLALCWWTAGDVSRRAEIVPIVMFAITMAIAYRIELAIIMSAMVALLFSVCHGYGLSELVILTAASSTAALLCRSIRSRSKLVYVGIAVALAVFPTVIGVHCLMGQPVGRALITDASWFSFYAALSGLFMTALLPFLEWAFDIQTDISLLELSDANHPLLRELVQRAPGTYNHSINVASISEAAALAIGANGLLCRVGAYFHDIGKIRKPAYFIENQAAGENKHDDLNPAMSTLVIVAHVKEGAEMARQHDLPDRIIDLIEQHHGTTLVSYFFDRATRQGKLSEESTKIKESDYRYPGPKPQSREAAVMMLADAVESASRALREPTPSRIDKLVKEIAKHKLDDGQFDECDLTLKQLHVIAENLVKSLNAMYHARVTYPDQQTA